MIVYSCCDLMFATKIRSTAEALGVPSRPARDEEMLVKRLDQVDDGRVNDPVTGVLIDLDLGEDGLGLIEKVKAHDDTIAVVAFGSHVAADMLEAARQRGADYVMPRSSFTANLPQIVEQFGKVGA